MDHPDDDLIDARVCVVASRFNRLVTERLEEGAVTALREAGVAEEGIRVVRVPGAWELPYAVRAVSSEADAVVAVGCVARGETPHFGYVCDAATRGLMACQQEGDVPVGFGLLTVDTVEQGLQRAGGKHGNKGAEAAEAAVEMLRLGRAVP